MITGVIMLFGLFYASVTPTKELAVAGLVVEGLDMWTRLKTYERADKEGRSVSQETKNGTPIFAPVTLTKEDLPVQQHWLVGKYLLSEEEFVQFLGAIMGEQVRMGWGNTVKELLEKHNVHPDILAFALNQPIKRDWYAQVTVERLKNVDAETREAFSKL